MSYLLELSRSRPIAEQFPPTGRAADREPWFGNEAERFVSIYRNARELTAVVKQLRSTHPDHEEVKKGLVMLKHLSARRDALLNSWFPKGRLQ